MTTARASKRPASRRGRGARALGYPAWSSARPAAGGAVRDPRRWGLDVQADGELRAHGSDCVGHGMGCIVAARFIPEDLMALLLGSPPFSSSRRFCANVTTASYQPRRRPQMDTLALFDGVPGDKLRAATFLSRVVGRFVGEIDFHAVQLALMLTAARDEGRLQAGASPTVRCDRCAPDHAHRATAEIHHQHRLGRSS